MLIEPIDFTDNDAIEDMYGGAMFDEVDAKEDMHDTVFHRPHHHSLDEYFPGLYSFFPDYAEGEFNSVIRDIVNDVIRKFNEEVDNYKKAIRTFKKNRKEEAHKEALKEFSYIKFGKPLLRNRKYFREEEKMPGFYYHKPMKDIAIAKLFCDALQNVKVPFNYYCENNLRNEDPDLLKLQGEYSYLVERLNMLTRERKRIDFNQGLALGGMMSGALGAGKYSVGDIESTIVTNTISNYADSQFNGTSFIQNTFDRASENFLDGLNPTRVVFRGFDKMNEYADKIETHGLTNLHRDGFIESAFSDVRKNVAETPVVGSVSEWFLSGFEQLDNAHDLGKTKGLLHKAEKRLKNYDVSSYGKRSEYEIWIRTLVEQVNYCDQFETCLGDWYSWYARTRTVEGFTFYVKPVSRQDINAIYGLFEVVTGGKF